MAVPLVTFLTNVQPQITMNGGPYATGLFNVEANSLLVMCFSGGGAAGGDTYTPTSVPTLTWTKQADKTGSTGESDSEIWTANVGGSDIVGGVVNVQEFQGLSNPWAGTLLKVNNHGESTFGGATAIAPANQSNGTFSFTTTAADSLIIGNLSDWSALGLTGRTMVSGSTELDYQNPTNGTAQATIVSQEVFWATRATAGAQSVGTSAPGSGTYVWTAIEVRAGSTGPPATPPSPPTPQENAFPKIEEMIEMARR